MGAFVCSRCRAYCCTCQGCFEQVARDGTKGCRLCIPSYEQQLVNSQQKNLNQINNILANLPDITPPHLKR